MADDTKTFGGFYRYWQKRISESYRAMRKGQALMNALYEYDERAYNQLTWKKEDPFYVDDKIEPALEWLYNYYESPEA